MMLNKCRLGEIVFSLDQARALVGAKSAHNFARPPLLPI